MKTFKTIFFSKGQINIMAFKKQTFQKLGTLLLLISARFEFDSVIYFNFCLFWVSFIY
jgi:hypothetical protein